MSATLQLLAQQVFRRLVDYRVLQQPLTGRGWWVVLLDDACPVPRFRLQLERRLKEVDVEACDRIKLGEGRRGGHAAQATVADQSAHNGAVLLLDPGLVVLLVGSCAGAFDLLLLAEVEDCIVHERAVIVRVQALEREWQQRLRRGESVDDQALLAHEQGEALRPPGGDVGQHERVDEVAVVLLAATVRRQLDLPVATIRFAG